MSVFASFRPFAGHRREEEHDAHPLPRGVALVDRHSHWATAAVGEEPVVHLELVLLAVAVVADRSERAGLPLEVAGGEVVEGQASGLQVSCRKLLLD